MKVRSFLVGAAVLAGVAFAPGKASAQCGLLTYSATLGLGGSLNGCFTATVQQVGENALGVGSQFFWNGNFAGSTLAAPSNAPILAGTQFTGSAATDNCQNNPGGFGSSFFTYCTGGVIPPALLVNGGNLPSIGSASQSIFNAAGEFVIGMNAQDLTNPLSNGGTNYWLYSGAQARNAFPAPAGFQMVLYQLANNGVAIDGEFLFAWEDVNSGCAATSGGALHTSLTLFDIQHLGDKPWMDDPNNCISFNPGGSNSDNDFNDSYILLNIQGQRLDNVVPEPMTMTLMATGLVGLAGAQIRRRKKNQG